MKWEKGRVWAKRGEERGKKKKVSPTQKRLRRRQSLFEQGTDQMALRSTVSLEYFNLTSESTEDNMHREVGTLVGSCKADKADLEHFTKEMQSFERLFKTYIATRHHKLDWSLISPPKDDLILPLATLPKATHSKELANKLCILKLNGGLGTTMGCVGPKSAIEVREGSSFLDLNVKQVKVRNFLMKQRVARVSLQRVG